MTIINEPAGFESAKEDECAAVSKQVHDEHRVHPSLCRRHAYFDWMDAAEPFE